ncbi:MAG: hypothetical protein KI790_20300 [Cyclobacteriaceae bacterium]|nr:hypothetical protein [Cyclobacteriaceae bacterium HetDA_MAG_MS6]
MAKNDFVSTFIESVKSDVAGLIAVSVVEIDSGMTFGSFSTKKDFDPEVASAFNVEVVKSKLSAIKALGLKQKIDDILITLSEDIHILKVTPNAKYMIYLAADLAKANLGMTRSVLRTLSKEVEEKLQ